MGQRKLKPLRLLRRCRRRFVAHRLLNLLVGLSFPSLLSYFGIGGAFLLYAVFNFAGGLFCVLAMLETRSHTLGAIRRMLTRSIVSRGSRPYEMRA